jgi:lipopolysaccharide/colanic/teichoic acid biosynthesis glycosyltransferase
MSFCSFAAYVLYYIDWPLWLDFKIMARTVLSRSDYRSAY